MANELTKEGRRIVPLEPSSPVDPRAQLPDQERQTEVQKLSNGTVLTTYTEPPLASEYTANKPDPDEYEAFLDEVIAEVDAEQGRDELPERSPLPLNRLKGRELLDDAR